MRNQKFINQILLLLCTLLPVLSHADRLTEFKPIAQRPAYVLPNFKKTWMLDIHISELRDENILDGNNHLTFLQPKNTFLNTIPSEITRIHIYGNGLTKNTTAVVYGNITRDVFEDLVIKKVIQPKQRLTLIEKKDIKSGSQTITKLVFKSTNLKVKKVIYYADVTVGIWTASSNITELRRWMDHPYGYSKTNNSKMLSVWMEVKSTLNNIQKDNGEDNYLLQSKILKLTKSFLATIQRNDDSLYFATKLTTSNRSNTNNLAKIIDSLIATDSKNSSSILSKIFLNINKEHKDKTITISSQVLKTTFNNK